jgi:hypothetical protein
MARFTIVVDDQDTPGGAPTVRMAWLCDDAQFVHDFNAGTLSANGISGAQALGLLMFRDGLRHISAVGGVDRTAQYDLQQQLRERANRGEPVPAWLVDLLNKPIDGKPH